MLENLSSIENNLKTEEQIRAFMASSRDANDWNRRIGEVEKANGGELPPFWDKLILESGMFTEMSFNKQ